MRAALRYAQYLAADALGVLVSLGILLLFGAMIGIGTMQLFYILGVR